MSNDNKSNPDKSARGQEGNPQGRSSRRRRRSQRGRKQNPENRPPEPARKQKESSRPPDEYQSGKLSRANMIVMVDDDPAYVEMESLAVVNYVSGFNSMGFTAIDKAVSYITSPRNESRIRLVLLNLETAASEGMGQEKLLETLRKHGNIPLVAISCQNSAESIERALRLGVVGFLTKAFTMDVFVRFVKDVLRKGRVSGWQCIQCGKLVPMDQVDLLNMRPIKCAHRDCVSSEIREVHFSLTQAIEKAG